MNRPAVGADRDIASLKGGGAKATRGLGRTPYGGRLDNPAIRSRREAS